MSFEKLGRRNRGPGILAGAAHHRVRRGWPRRRRGSQLRANKEARESAEREMKSAITTSSTTWWMSEAGDVGPAHADAARPSQPSWRSSGFPSVGNIAGCRERRHRGARANVRLIRDSVVVHEGKLSQLSASRTMRVEVTAGRMRRPSKLPDMKVGRRNRVLPGSRRSALACKTIRRPDNLLAESRMRWVKRIAVVFGPVLVG